MPPVKAVIFQRPIVELCKKFDHKKMCVSFFCSVWLCSAGQQDH